MKQWQQRPVEPVYFVVWTDGIVLSVRQNGKVQNKTIYWLMGFKEEGKKQVMGLCINKTESALFWLSKPVYFFPEPSHAPAVAVSLKWISSH